ncbi:putrescine export ABC transporter ATP-binding protein SapF [Arsenophonus symbiont of Ornithomya chloropus]|uniref:putrescine export ABC transporter ATP-binding protein SapF n=1 Tax=Arsenophonus symbiont of Ornithomya chloropus TaxID=634121 RepID=UPI0032B30101
MSTTLLEIKNLSKFFYHRINLFNSQLLEAVKPLSFTLNSGETLAIIGTNGSGKSTLARMLAGVLEPSNGEIFINGHKLNYGDYSYRSQHIRMIFQDPSTSLTPKKTIGQILEFVLILNTSLSIIDRKNRIKTTLRQVGLLPYHAGYYPRMLAVGQRQRVGLARALILRPKIIIADEALALLDMTIRSQIINLMIELQEKYGISYIYVTQNLGMMKHISDTVLVMNNGTVVERGNTAEVLASPLHEVTRRLISSHFGELLSADSWRQEIT